ncbi:hypothetical protein V8F20_005906 [Naviculisporaceae sp. PSN 640]
MPPYRRLRMPSSSSVSISPKATAESIRPSIEVKDEKEPNRPSTEVKDEMASNDEGEDGSSFSNTQISEGPRKRQRKADPPPAGARSIPCLPCIGRAVKTPGHQCYDCGANEAALSNACWHCSYVNRHRKTCVELPAELREEFLYFWNLNSKLPQGHVRNAEETDHAARINKLLLDYRKRAGGPRSTGSRDSLSQAGTPNGVAEKPFAREFIAREPIAIEPTTREPLAGQPVARETIFVRKIAAEPISVRTPAAVPRYGMTSGPAPSFGTTPASVPRYGTTPAPVPSVAPSAHQSLQPMNVMGGTDDALAAVLREQTAAMRRQTEVMEGVLASLHQISRQMVRLYLSLL